METNRGLLGKFKAVFGDEMRAQAARLEAAETGLREAREWQRQLEESFERQIDILEKLMDSASGAAPAMGSTDSASKAQAEPSADAQQKVLNEAQRFARLLVSEIELYHGDQVAQGRQHRDLYSRVRSAIELSKQTYDKHFGTTAAAPFNYFHFELVRILAANDPALLGPDYPGPTS